MTWSELLSKAEQIAAYHKHQAELSKRSSS